MKRLGCRETTFFFSTQFLGAFSLFFSFFCKKVPNYLHISKKSSTFAPAFENFVFQSSFRKGGWVAETNSLLNCRTGNCTGGSNPPSSAKKAPDGAFFCLKDPTLSDISLRAKQCLVLFFVIHKDRNYGKYCSAKNAVPPARAFAFPSWERTFLPEHISPRLV